MSTPTWVIPQQRLMVFENHVIPATVPALSVLHMDDSRLSRVNRFLSWWGPVGEVQSGHVGVALPARCFPGGGCVLSSPSSLLKAQP